jgi:hypothetical protein
MTRRSSLSVAAAMLLLAAPCSAVAQTGTRSNTTQSSTTQQTALPSRCASVVSPVRTVSESAKAEAREIGGRAQAASIVGDNAAATALYQQAAQLNPGDASIAYALGREYEATHDKRAMGEYCRFLVLTPGATEAADVRQRIGELALALPPDTTVVRLPATVADHVAMSAQMPAPGAALGAGLIVPGMGQFTTHRPAAGLLVMAAAGAAAWYGLQSQSVRSQVTNTAVDPFGNPYQFQTTAIRTERPHVAVGLGAAAAVTLTAAIEAFTHARARRVSLSDSRSASASDVAASASGSAAPEASHSVAPVLTVTRQSIGLGITLW